MSKVFFDFAAAQPLRGSVHGGGEYARSVLTSLLDNGYGGRLLTLIDSTRGLPDYFDALVETHGLQCIPFDSKDALQNILKSGQGSRFFSALPYALGDLDLSGLDVVFTIHGLRPIELPTDRYEYLYTDSVSGIGKWAAKQLFRGAYRKAQQRKFQSLLVTNARSTSIVVPSEHTRSAVLECLSMPDNVAVNTLYSPSTAVIDDFVEDASVLDDLGLRDRGYFLMVSGNRWIKNAYRGLVAMRSLWQTCTVFREFDVVLTGGLPARMRSPGIDNVKVLPYVEHRQLRALYAHAYALVYPTLNEGFGYPPIESMACGTPVICSDTCSLPEIAGDAPVYFSATEPAEIEAALRTMIESPETWRRHKALGDRRCAEVGSRQRNDLRKLSQLIVGE